MFAYHVLTRFIIMQFDMILLIIRIISFSLQVILLKNNTATFSRIIFLKFMFESVLEEKFDQDKLVSIYRVLFHKSKKKPKSKSTETWLHIRIDSAIRSV